ncbi:MAG: DNA methyltransferase [Candidatus Melainabacteria bacterium]|nr:DNA methyltransferase [Candidatus Melainabacteria bacterium]
MARAQTQRKTKLKTGLAELIAAEDIQEHKGRLITSSYQLEDSWKQKKRNWGHSLHGMASRSGSFPPSLAAYFIDNFSLVGDTVLDPFSGKGTTALQACLTERFGIGLDVAPEAYALTAAKTITIKEEEAIQYLEELKLPRVSKAQLDAVPAEVKIFYHEDVLKQILAFREAIAEDYSFRHLSYLEAPQFENKKSKRAKFAQYWAGVMIGILHGSSEISLSLPCSHSYSMSPNYVNNYAKKHGLERPQRDLKQCLIKRSAKLMADGESQQAGRAILGSAMELPRNLVEKIDLIVTSPPYFTAQSYAWDNWLREWFLGFDFKEVRKQTLHTAVEQKYADAMGLHLEEAYKVLKPGRWAFYVVGDVIKKAKAGAYKIITAEIIAQEAERAGFDVELIINDDIPRTSCYNSAFLKEDQGLKLDRVVCLYKA